MTTSLFKVSEIITPDQPPCESEHHRLVCKNEPPIIIPPYPNRNTQRRCSCKGLVLHNREALIFRDSKHIPGLPTTLQESSMTLYSARSAYPFRAFSHFAWISYSENSTANQFENKGSSLLIGTKMAQFTDFRPFTQRLEPPCFFIFRLISVLLRHTRLLRHDESVPFPRNLIHNQHR
jgi:hypothetical protein